MVRKCTVFNCRTGYPLLKADRPNVVNNGDKDSKTKKSNKENNTNYGTKVHRFPEHAGDRDSWVKAIPSKVPDPITDHIGVCANHWPKDVEMKRIQRHVYPAVPPSIFCASIPPSIIPTQPLPPRTTTKSSSTARNTFDQSDAFYQKYSFSAVDKSKFLPRFVQKLHCGKAGKSS